MTIVAAPAELVALARVMRPDWDITQFEGALAACRMAGFSWPRTLRTATLILADEDGHPRELLDQVRDPARRTGHGQPVTPERNAEHAARARQLLGIPEDPR